jgi:hypothetical protein
MHHYTALSFVDGFHPFTTYKTDDRTLFFVGACCKRDRHTTSVPSCCIPASYYHMSATLQTMSITVVNLQDNRAVFRIFIVLLRFSFDSPSYVQEVVTVTAYFILKCTKVTSRLGWQLVPLYFIPMMTGVEHNVYNLFLPHRVQSLYVMKGN